MKKTILSIILLTSLNVISKTYYVSVVSVGVGSGSKENPMSSITNALTKCKDNDTIFVNSGIYNSSTTINKPCTIIGIDSVIFDGKNRAGGKICFNITANNVKIFKINIRNYTYGINIASSTGCCIDKVSTSCTGDIISSYSGRGIQLGSYSVSSANSNTIINCTIRNSAAEGLSINGDNNYVFNCSIKCDENTANAATDYYLIINGNNNIISNCHTERIGNLSHYGHGIGFKGNCQNNLVINCRSVNMSECFYVRHRGVKYNTFVKCKAYNSVEGAYAIRDGASYNTFTNCSDTLGYSSIDFFDTVEDGGATYCGRFNIFNNCSFKNKQVGIYFNEYSVESIADSNLVANCTFENIKYFTEVSRPNGENFISNCILKNIPQYKSGSTQLNLKTSYIRFINSQTIKP